MKTFYFIFFIGFMILFIWRDFSKRRDAVMFLSFKPPRHGKFILMALLTSACAVVVVTFVEKEHINKILWMVSAGMLIYTFGLYTYMPLCVTPTHIGKLWYVSFNQLEYLSVYKGQNKSYLLYKKTQNKKEEKMEIPVGEEHRLSQQLKKLDVKLKRAKK